jgi:hypothetical protein
MTTDEIAHPLDPAEPAEAARAVEGELV